MSRALLVARLIGSLGLLIVQQGCQPTAASRGDCEAVLGRIIAIELRELGYRDPALLELKRRELARRFETDLQACVGRPLSPDAMRCVAEANSTEAISHVCLR
jgi:hypothetical protein